MHRTRLFLWDEGKSTGWYLIACVQVTGLTIVSVARLTPTNFTILLILLDKHRPHAVEIQLAVPQTLLPLYDSSTHACIPPPPQHPPPCRGRQRHAGVGRARRRRRHQLIVGRVGKIGVRVLRRQHRV